MRGVLVDCWRRLIPGRPRIDRTAFYASHAELPASLPRHQLALVGGAPERPKWAVFECPCGVGHRIAVPLGSRRQPTWRVILDDGAQPSLSPSIDSNDGRRCHFWVRDGRIEWAPDRRRGRRGEPL
jgi:hypothetical protein